MPETVYLVDGTYSVFRAYFAIQRLNAPDGTPTNAVFGFINTLRKVARERAPHYFGVAFDLEGKTHRDERYEEYKAHRPAPPDDLIPQFALAMEACEALRWPVLTAEGFEADDVLATLARQARERGLDVVIVTSDKDLYQLVDPHVQVLNPAKGDLMLDSAGVLELFGARPEQVRDVLALMGDAADNVPGVPGIGEKTAKGLVARYGTIERLLERAQLFKTVWESRDMEQPASFAQGAAEKLAQLERNLGGEEADSLAPRLEAAIEASRSGDLKAAIKSFKALEKGTSPKIWLSLAENESAARLSYELVTIRADAPVELDLEALRLDPPDAPRALELFTRLGFRSLAQEMASAQPQVESLADRLERMVLDDAARLPDQLASFRAARFLSVDTETDSLSAHRSKLVGISLAMNGEGGAYLPVGHRTGEAQADWSAIKPEVARLLSDKTVRKCGQNLKYDRASLRRAGVLLEGIAFDTLIAAQLLDPGRGSSHKLDDLALRYLGEKMVPYSEVSKTAEGETTLDNVAIEKVARYAIEDAVVAWRLVEPLREELKKADLLELFETIEMPLVPILEQMEWWGIKVDRDSLVTMSERMERELAQLESEIYALAGHPFSIQSPQQLRVVLFEELKLKPVGRRTQKTREHSTGSEALEQLSASHPLPRKVLEFREIAKLKSTYVDTLPKLIDAEDGRVHGQFHQLGAATGRLSSSDPNLQNIPVRSELGRSIRAAFVPEPGWSFLSADYSQMELRILAHLADDPALIEAFQRDLDIHAYTASLVEGMPIDLVTPAARSRAKAVNFGIIYGMSEFRLARDQGISREAARQFIESYFARYSRVREYIDGTIREVQQRGETRTLFGRVRRFQELIGSGEEGRGRPEREALLRQAVNATIQGTAADIAKRAMIEVDRRLTQAGLKTRLLLQVHDELLLEVPPGEEQAAERLVREGMEGAAQLSVPMKVELRLAASWAEAH